MGLKYYVDLNDVPVHDLLRQASIKTKNCLMDFSDPVVNIVYTLEEIQEHTLLSIKVVQLTMAYMFQYQFLNPVQKVITIQHALQGWLSHIS